MTRVREITIIGALTVILFFALAYGIYSSITSRALGANDFFSRWEGARALFLRGENPYSDATTSAIQMGMSGRLARPDEDQVAFAYPLYSAFIAAPLISLPYAQAQAGWMAFLILAVAGGTIALLKSSDDFHAVAQLAVKAQSAAARLQNALLLLLALLFYPTVRAIFNGQYAIPSFFFITLAMALIAAQHDAAAGIFLALATIKPQTALFLVPAMLVWSARNQRWQIVIAASLGLGALILVSLALVPTWVFDFVRGLRHYADYEPIGPPLEIVIGYLVSDVSWRSGLIMLGVLALVGWAAWRVSRTMDGVWESFLPTLGLIAILTTIWAGRIGSSDQVLLLIPGIAWLSEWITQKKIAWAVIAALVILILPWVVFFATLRGNAENIAVSLVLPFLSLAVFLFKDLRPSSVAHRRKT